NKPIAPIFDEGTATLNGVPFTSGMAITVDGEYELVVTDAAGNKTVVKFTLEGLLGEPVQLPGVPTRLSGAVDGKQVTLTWQKPHDSGTAIEDYVIQYSHDGGQTWSTATDALLTGTRA